jgi:ankyrin repeat protein
VDLQIDEVKFEILIALKRDDPVLLEQIMKSKSVSYQEKINERVDMNWTILHIAAAKNAYKATEYLLTAYLSFTDPAFDLVNARDFSGKTPLMLASDYSSFKTFESILQLCTRFNHPVIMDQKYEKSFDKSSPYFVLL